jgi:hypothetical protein
MSCNPALRLLAVISAAVFVFPPVAGAGPGSPSYEQGKQAIDDQFNQHHVHPAADWFQDQQYCQQLLTGVLKSGMVPRIDSREDFIAGCQDEGRALLASQ